MFLMLDNDTFNLIEKVESEVASKLDVEDATICITTAPDTEDGVQANISFSTSEDDTFAYLDVSYDDLIIKDILKSFTSNPNVKWFKKANEIFYFKFQPPNQSYMDLLSFNDVQVLKEIINNFNQNKFTGNVQNGKTPFSTEDDRYLR